MGCSLVRIKACELLANAGRMADDHHAGACRHSEEQPHKVCRGLLEHLKRGESVFLYGGAVAAYPVFRSPVFRRGDQESGGNDHADGEDDAADMKRHADAHGGDEEIA